MDKILLTTGGTGGHIFPALAVAEEVRRRNPDAKLLFVGSEYGPEGRLCARAGIDFAGLPVRGFLGRGFRAFGAAARMGVAVGKALALVRGFRPDAVTGFGGYAAFAPMLAARLSGVPALLHEQNAVAGTSNRVLARLARKVCISLPGTRGFPAENACSRAI
ncbi:glycosyltransferase, partial [Desulfovibrio sp.]|uniref:UDP-N-acetylglucosamine--N-acetylmuramyl- (pentapeptide) pyrophosphoryl-undecaprenol N-acetylglucosamine transferase n=1 Tax=Desulfovibrio sp. TaxID=885 RepID=UPI002606C37D